MTDAPAQTGFRFEPPDRPDTLAILADAFGPGDPRFVELGDRSSVRVKTPAFGWVEEIEFAGRTFVRTGERTAGGWPVFKQRGNP